MSDDFKITSVIFCEDIRKEWNAKQILIGVLPSTILFPVFPITMLALGIRVALQTNVPHFNDMVLELQGPDGVPIIAFGGPLDVNGNEAVLTIVQPGMRFKAAGEYKLYVGPRGKTINAYTLQVGLSAPQDTTSSLIIPATT